jgi:LCP family protein required for cell wall assembly
MPRAHPTAGTTVTAALTVRHRARPRRRVAARLVKAVALVLAVALASGLSVGAIYSWQLATTVSSNALDISNGQEPAPLDAPSIGAFDGGFNVLAVGADNVSGQSAAFGDRKGAALNDVNILFHVAADHRSAVVLSLPRDLMIPGPACTDPATGNKFSAVSLQPLNSAFGRGGLGCVVSTVSELTGLDIPYAALFTFEGTVRMSDAVGGVPICVDSAINDPASGLDLPAGVSVVSGQQALAYLRSRKGVGDASDLSRIGSQQAYMSSLMRVMKSSETLTNVPKVLALANATAENVSLSESLAPLPTMISMALTLKDLDLAKMTFVTYPWQPFAPNPNKIEPNTAVAEQLLAHMASDEPFALDGNALGSSVALDPSAAPDAQAPADIAPGATAPPVLGGIQGVTAAERTCSVAH